MPELLKDVFSDRFIQQLAQRFSQARPSIKAEQLTQSIYQGNWPQLTLTQRIACISEALHQQLQELPFNKQIAILKLIASHYPKAQHGSLTLLPFPHFIGAYGLQQPKPALEALAFFTEYASGEFAIRPFLIEHPTLTFEFLQQWQHHPSVHVRRLASEGPRPLLPWGKVLHKLKQNPAPMLPILQHLAKDPSPYVRKSVANHLNDISKTHPQTALNFAQQIQAQPHSQSIIKHGLRHLLKQSEPQALALIGIHPPKHIALENFSCDNHVAIGGKLNFSFTLTSPRPLGQLRIEYAIGFLRINGQHNFKRFHLSSKQCTQLSLNVSKQHDFKKLSSRRYYAGEQILQVFINGQLVQKTSFELL